MIFELTLLFQLLFDSGYFYRTGRISIIIFNNRKIVAFKDYGTTLERMEKKVPVPGSGYGLFPLSDEHGGYHGNGVYRPGFLSNYSLDAISAVAPAGIAVFLIVAFFGGVAGYTNIFIAQYCGASAHKRVGVALWQGLYFSLFSGILTAFAVTLIAKPLFILAGHAPEIQRL